MCIFSAKGLGKRIIFEDSCKVLVSPSLTGTRQHCLVQTTPKASLGECCSQGPSPPRPLGISQRNGHASVNLWLALHKTGSNFIYSCTKLVSYSEVERSWLLDGFWCAFRTSFGAAVWNRGKEKCYLQRIKVSSATVLKQKGCEVVTEAWETGQERGQVKQTGFCWLREHLVSPVGRGGIVNALLFCRSNCSGLVYAGTVTAVSSHVTGSWIWHHMFPVIRQNQKCLSGWAFYCLLFLISQLLWGRKSSFEFSACKINSV